MRIRVGPRFRRSAALLLVAVVSACGTARAARQPPVAPAPVEVSKDRGARARGGGATTSDSLSETALLRRRAIATARGEATYYADKFDGRRTASGVVFRNSRPYAAHRTYPFGTVLRVTNTRNQRQVIVRVVDRGPHGTTARARRTIIDLSRSVAERLGFVRAGRAPVLVEVIQWGDGRTAW